MAAKRKQRIAIHTDGEFRVLDIGQIEIWDGADLALLRDSMTEAIHQGSQHIGVEMGAVKYIPSGFFGMLFDWQDRGVSMRLYRPQPNVKRMLWFRQFFADLGDGVFAMSRESLFDDDDILQPPEDEVESILDEELEPDGDAGRPEAVGHSESSATTSRMEQDPAEQSLDIWNTAHWLVVNDPADKPVSSDSETSMAAHRD